MKTSILARIVRVAENLYRDPESGRYYGKKKINRKPKLRSLDTTDRPTANRELKKWIAGLDGDTAAPDRKLDALLATFLAIRKGKAPGTFANEESIAKRFRQTFTLGMSVTVRKIPTSSLMQWLTNEAEKSGWKASYFNAVRLFLRGLFDIAVADRIIDESTNPFKAKIIKARKREKTIRRIPTLEQFNAIIKSVRAQRDNHLREQSADFLAFLALAGVGQAEASSVRWIDIESARISFKRQKTAKAFTVPIFAWLAPLIAKLRSQRNGAADDALIFKIDEARKALTGACKRLGFYHFTQRNLRAMCIKRLADIGISAKQIAKWQGHSDGGVLIQNIYTEVFSDNDDAQERANLALVSASVNAKAKRAPRVARGKIIQLAA